MKMQKDNTEHNLIKQALQALREKAGLCFNVEEAEITRKDRQIEAIITLNEGETRFAAVVKKWAQQANLGALMKQVKNLPEKGVLIADYIDPKMADKLQQQDVQFIDTAGNAYLNVPNTYIYVKGNRREASILPATMETKRAFEPKGLKVIFAFLCTPELVKAPYREIADKAGVAVGTVGLVLNGLKAIDLIRDKGKNKTRRIVNYQKLLDRWVEAYPEKLRPKQLLGEFLADEPNWWKNVNIQKYDAYWGGEIAAAKYTDYLKPQVATVYLNDTALTPFLLDMRLRKTVEWNDNNANIVTIYKIFWKDEPNMGLRKELVDPILVYADLIATGDTRNIEVARRIYDEHIAQHIRED